MYYICPICSDKWKSGQQSIQCLSCKNWIHHNNKNNCSGLTNIEFDIHCNNKTKPWECDACISAKYNKKSFFLSSI